MKLIITLVFLIITVFAFASIPPGYYSTLNGKQSAALKTELHKILMADTSRYYSYGSGESHTWQGFYSTDRDPITNLIIDMYSDSLRYFPTDYINLGYPGFGQKIHIEHSLPKSWWGSYQWAAYKDLNHLYPSDGSTNLSKSNNPLGIVTGTPTKDNGVSKIGPGVYEGYTGNVFEPADQYKGDFARTYFYMATAYQHYTNLWDQTLPENMMENNTYPTLKPGAVKLLLEWSRMDPVSSKELTRIEKVYGVQHNRNPFIDYPELAEYIWGTKIGEVWTTTNTKTISTFKSEISVFPNPAKDKIQILGTNNQSVYQYTIFTLEGSIIEQSETNKCNIDITR